MPSLLSEVTEGMEAPITDKELVMAIESSKLGKAPGPDGLNLAYYKTFQDVLTPYFLHTYNSISANSKLTEDTLRAYIMVIPKQDKDHTQCGNHRPIRLLIADLKLFSKILANSLLPYIPHLVHTDQAGFIPQTEARDDTVRAIDLIPIGGPTIFAPINRR